MRRTLLAIISAIALAALGSGLVMFERAKDGVRIIDRSVGVIPVTNYTVQDGTGPLAVVAHGFSGSRAMVQALALNLARGGYRVTTLDFPGHGDNPDRLSAEFVDPEGATRQLENTISAVIDAELRRTGNQAPVALIGHSMATDIIIRLAARDPEIGPVIAVSMYSDAVTASSPNQMLAISGEFEPSLRQAALDAARQVDPEAMENRVVESADGRVRRGVIVAPRVEHVGVLYSPVTLSATIEWLDAVYRRSGEGARQHVAIGLPILLILAGAFALFWPISQLMGASTRTIDAPPRLWLPLLAPPILTPVVLSPLQGTVIPMPGMTYLTAHLAVYGLLALAFLWRAGIRPAPDGWRTPALLVAYAIGVIAVLIDRTFSDFLPSPERITLLFSIALGTIPFMVADSLLLKARDVPWWLRFASRLAFFASLAAAIALMPTERLLLAFFLPILILFFLVFGSMARWLQARQPAPTMTGVAQGVLLAYAIASTVPLIDPGTG